MQGIEGLLAHIKQRLAPVLFAQYGADAERAEVVLDAIDEAAAEYTGEPEPFAVGATVQRYWPDGIGIAEHAASGKVTKRVEAEGELHTVWVAWPDMAAMPYSPSELREVK